LKCLHRLALTKCPITTVPGYREQVFAMLPSLEVLDGKNKKGEEVYEEEDDDDEEEGEYVEKAPSSEDDEDDDELAGIPLGEESDSDEAEVIAPGKRGAPVKGPQQILLEDDDDDEEEEDDEESEEGILAHNKVELGAPAKKEKKQGK